MNKQHRKDKARETWIKIYEELGSVSKAARRCGIPRSSLYRWIARSKRKEPLFDRSRRPNRLAKKIITPEYEKLILTVREQFRFGQHRISTHLHRKHKLNISPSTIWRVLNKNRVQPI